jgi:hypothetical protein
MYYNKKEITISVKAPNLFRYNQGEHIQNSFSYLTPNERDWLMTGIIS